MNLKTKWNERAKLCVKTFISLELLLQKLKEIISKYQA